MNLVYKILIVCLESFKNNSEFEIELTFTMENFLANLNDKKFSLFSIDTNKITRFWPFTFKKLNSKKK